MQIVERIDSWHRRTYLARPHYVGIVKHHEVRMGELAFIMAHKVNGVSALHSDLVKKDLFPELNTLHPGRVDQPDQWRDAAPLAEDVEPAAGRPDHRQHRRGLGG